ncbi:hybrid sensor histidine kinase/response regulator, partial [bacterium]|nr:hybrid sensor histidine kinase/response regulator [bacterium]
MNDKPMKVLLVEDNAGDARLIREALTEANAKQFKLVHVERLADALKRLAKEKWDVVLLDLSLPDA